MSTVTDPFITYLTQDLYRLHQEKATGEMILRYQDMSVTLYLLAGRLQYAVDKKYRVRRWQRAVTQYCRDWQVPTQMLNSQPWEYDFLYQGLSKSKITLEQAKAVIKSVTEECLYEMGLMAQVEKKWIPHDRVKSTFSYFLSLSLAEIHPVLIEIAEMHNQWEREHLQVLNLSLSPVLTEKGKAIPQSSPPKISQRSIYDVGCGFTVEATYHTGRAIADSLARKGFIGIQNHCRFAFPCRSYTRNGFQCLECYAA